MFQVFGLFTSVVGLVGFFEIIFGNVHDLIAVVLSKGIENSFIKRIIAQNYFIAFLNKSFDQWRVLQSISVLSTEEINVLLALLHSGDVLVKRSKL